MNRYVVLWPELPAPHPIDLRDEATWPGELNVAYFAGALREMEAATDADGLTFYLVYGDYQALPSYGPDVVVLLPTDEMCRYLPYAARVGAVFRCFGTHPYVEPLTASPQINAMLMVRAARGAVVWLGDWLRAQRGGTLRHDETPQFVIPQGYSRQDARPVRPIAERAHDVSFLGSVQHRAARRHSLRDWAKSPPFLQSPKLLSRRRMVEAVEALRQRRPDLSVHLKTTSGYQESLASGTGAYSQAMMDTKICLAPRGSVIDTARFFEGMRYGCVVVTEPHPRRWFYTGSPAIELRSWDELEPTVARLLADPDALERCHRASLAWWRDVCSEAALGRFLAGRLGGVLARTTPEVPSREVPHSLV